MTWSIDIAPMVPAPLLVAAIVVALALIAVLFFRRTRGAALRALALAAIVAALANPSFRQEERESLANIAVVLVDESTSQSIAGRPAQTAAIRADLEEKLDKVSSGDLAWKTLMREFWTDFSAAIGDIAELRITNVIDALNESLGPHIFPPREDGTDPRECPLCKQGALCEVEWFKVWGFSTIPYLALVAFAGIAALSVLSLWSGHRGAGEAEEA